MCRIEELKNEMENLLSACKNISKIWGANMHISEQLEPKYPFDKCFNQVLTDIETWVDSVKEVQNEES